MKVGELIRWNPSNAAMWSDLVVILFPDRGRIPCLLQFFEQKWLGNTEQRDKCMIGVLSRGNGTLAGDHHEQEVIRAAHAPRV